MTSALNFPSGETDSKLLSIFTGIAVGIGFLALYLIAGLLFAQWNLSEFFSYLSIEIVLWLFVACLVIVAIFAIPVALYRQYRLVSPIVLLMVVLLIWLISGAITGAVFGLSLYVFGLAPVYIVLFIALGGCEYYLRN